MIEKSIAHIVERRRNIIAVQPFSTIDINGRISMVLFFDGCPLNCKLCHYKTNKLNSSSCKSLASLKDIIKSRMTTGIIDSVVLSGGEPTLFNVPVICSILKDYGVDYIGMETCGYFPEEVHSATADLNFIAIDMKHTPANYDNFVSKDGAFENFNLSLKYILDSGMKYEVRTTVFNEYHSEKDIIEMGKYLNEIGIKFWRLQRGRKVDQSYCIKAEEIKSLCSVVNSIYKDMVITNS